MTKGALESLENLTLQEILPMTNKKCWYDLGVNNTQLIISIRGDTWTDIIDQISNDGWIPTMEELTGEKWIPPSKFFPTQFGFGENNQFTVGRVRGWVICTVGFPPFETTSKPFACALKIIFDHLWQFGYNNEPDVSHEASASLIHPQLLTIEDIVFQSRDIRSGYGLGAEILSPLARWIAAYDKHGQTRYIHPEISQTMQDVALHMYKSEWLTKYPSDLRACHCEFSDYSGVYFHCEGDRCDLCHGGAHNSKPDPWPYTIGPHNCDSFRQQFVLFAGVAKLCEVARRDIH